MSEAPSNEPSRGDAPPRASAQPSGRALGGLFRHSAIYSLVPLIQKGATIVTTPIILTWVAVPEYGGFAILDLILVALGEILGMNLLQAMVRCYFDHTDERHRRAVISSATIVTGVMGWLVCGSMLFFVDELRPIVVGRGSSQVSADVLRDLLIIALLTVPFQLSTQSGLRYLQILRKSRLFSTIQLTKLFLELAMKIYFVGPWMNLGPKGLLLSVLIGEALGTLVITGTVLWKIGFRVKWRVLEPIVRYTLPMIPVGLCQLGQHKLDVRLLEAFSPLEDALYNTGIYAFGYQVGYLVNALMLGPFLQTWQPWIYAVRDERERGELVARVSTYALLFITAASLCIIFFGREALVLLSPAERDYSKAYQVLPFVVAAYVVWALYKAVEIPFFVAKRIKPLVWLNLTALVTNVALNYVLIPRLGYVGAGIATLMQFLCLAGLTMLASRTVAKVPFELGRILRTLATVALAGAAALRLDTWYTDTQGVPLLPILAVKAVLLGLIGSYLWRSVLVDEERRGFVDWLLRRRTAAG